MADQDQKTIDFQRMIASVSAEAEDRGKCDVKGVLVRVPPELHRDLKMLAVTHDTTIQALMLGAIREMVSRLSKSK